MPLIPSGEPRVWPKRKTIRCCRATLLTLIWFTGLTPIEAQGYTDFFIDRPLGMKGYILNLTIRGEG